MSNVINNPLRQAAKTLPGHWHKGSFFDMHGNACALGHVGMALGFGRNSIEDEVFSSDVFGRAHNLLNKVIAEQYPELGNWAYTAMLNDAEDTTEDEMVRVLEKAAVLWDEQI